MVSGKTLVFVKLGGSAITAKDSPRSLREEVVIRMGRALVKALEDPSLTLLLGHGGGSFGHFPAQAFQVPEGIHPEHGWEGWFRTSREMGQLREGMTRLLRGVGLPVLPLIPHCLGLAEEGHLASLDRRLVHEVLRLHRVPLLHGDTFLDRARGFTIISTEEIFLHLAPLSPKRVVLVGEQPGVISHLGTPEESLVREISPGDLPSLRSHLGRSGGVDVTGGMESKVKMMLRLLEAAPGETEGWIVGSQSPENLSSVILGQGGEGTRFPPLVPGAPVHEPK